MKLVLIVLIAAGFPRAAPPAADSSRGARLLQRLSCIQCHSINGKGGTAASDLGRSWGRDFTPASLAAKMWTHAPAMWASMSERNMVPAELNDQAAADLFAYFYAVGFLDKPGDAARGKGVFESKRCSECHGLFETKLPDVKPTNRMEIALPADRPCQRDVESQRCDERGLREAQHQKTSVDLAGPDGHGSLPTEPAGSRSSIRTFRDNPRRMGRSALSRQGLRRLPYRETPVNGCDVESRAPHDCDHSTVDHCGDA